MDADAADENTNKNKTMVTEAKAAECNFFLSAVLHQLDQKIIYPHYDFKHLTEKYFEIGMKLDDFLIQLVKYCIWGFAIFRNIPLFSIISADKVYFVEKFV